MKLSIIIPAYNEERRIYDVLEKQYVYFEKKLRGEFELIVVANNCSDNTFKISMDFSKGKNNVRAINIPFYVGKGGAVMEGFKMAEGEQIGFVDADRSTSPEELFNLYRNLSGYDGIIGSRRIKGAKVNPKRKINQRLSSLAVNILVRLLFGLNYKDTQCGAKIFKKKVAKFYTRNCSENGWLFDVNLLHISKLKNHRILEFPIVWTDDNENSKLTAYQGFLSLLHLIKYRLNSF